MGSLAFISAKERALDLDIQSLDNRLIKALQLDDLHLLVLRETVLQGGAKEVTNWEDGVLRLQGGLCVPNVDGLREIFLEGAHSSRYYIHTGATKMYRDLRKHYWWGKTKKDIVEYVARDLEFKEDDWGVLEGFPHEGYNAVQLEKEIESEVVGDPSLIVPVDTIEVNEKLTYEEIPVAILDRLVRKLRNKDIASVQVLWRSQKVEDATWEAEEEMKKKYPNLCE
ncbi:uncharacterized protein [Nicotiana tomentosiformis]|uniref:uncharacterized protein n=1 Tax=Nicotiana tomentosiformis TaxID=4098 RepID=UPI00388CC351